MTICTSENNNNNGDRYNELKKNKICEFTATNESRQRQKHEAL